MQTVSDFLSFVQNSPTAYQAAEQIEEALRAAGYRALCQGEPFDLVPGGKYFLGQGGSAVIAFRLPQGRPTHFQIVASHSDSPSFKLKSLQELPSPGGLRMNVEGYGGMIRASWMDRPLGVAGRLILRTPEGLVSRRVDLARDALLIPSLAIHMNREVNDGQTLNAQVDMLPLAGPEARAGWLSAQLAQAASCRPEDIVGHDLFLYNRTPGSIWGADRAYFSCPRIDDLECAYTALLAFLSAAPSEHIDVYAMLDNEEVGSGSPQGADSSLMAGVLRRIAAALSTDYEAMLAASFLVSADNAHAVHPNHPEKADEQHRCRMNEGIVVKHSAALKYTTDALSDAVFSEIAASVSAPIQHFWNRSDMAGGSTLGHLLARHASMSAVDIGLAQLAMHAAYETAGTADPDFMVSALRAFYETDIGITPRGATLR